MLAFNTIPTMLALAAFALGCNAPPLPTATAKAPTTCILSQWRLRSYALE